MRLKNITDWSEKFNGSVSEARKQIESGSIEVPFGGIIIKSASSSKRQNKEVYFFISTGTSTSSESLTIPGSIFACSNHQHFVST